jgi:hypothetical protein
MFLKDICRKNNMRKINTPILLANILTGLAFLAHTFGGDIEINSIQPAININNWTEKQQIWTMARCGWHWISFDLLFASIALALINFTNYFDNKKTILQLLSFYFFGYAIVWLLVLLISNSFPYNFLKLGQWILLLTISGLIFYGTKKQNA